MAEEKSVFGKFWFWLLIIGIILFVVGIISLIMKKYDWWVWTALAIGVLMLIIGGIGWAMDSAEEKGTTIARQVKQEGKRVIYQLDPRDNPSGGRRSRTGSPRMAAPPYDYNRVPK